MEKPKLRLLRWAGLIVALLALMLSPALNQWRDQFETSAGEPDLGEPFQFSDDFYRANGIEPDNLIDRLVFPDAKAGSDRTRDDESSPNSNFNDVRIIETTGGFDASGHPLYYLVNGKMTLSAFTDDAAGDVAFDLAESFRAFIFPKANGSPLSPMPPNRRQDNLFDTRNGYFSGNPLGLWALVFVSWDGPNVDGDDCQDEMADLAEDNGTDLDGTPIITSASDIDGLDSDGCVSLNRRALDGSQGFRWVV